MTRRTTALICTLVLACTLGACGGSGNSDAPAGITAARTYAVGGSVSGVGISGLKLTNHGGNELALDSAGAFTFSTELADGASYDVQVSQNPTAPAQVCTVANGQGTVASAKVGNVDVVCSILTLTITGMASTNPGGTPVLTFVARKNGVPLDLMANPLSSLKATLSGPTSDFADFRQFTIQGTGAMWTLMAVDAANGIFSYTFPVPMPSNAIGSFSVGLEGSVTDGAHPGVRYSAPSVVQAFAVTDASPVARRTVVDDAKCNACHASFTAHAGTARNVQYCAMCHNANLSNDTRVARFEDSTIVSQAMDLKVLIHKIHRGTSLSQQPYVIGSSPVPTPGNPAGTPVNYGLVNHTGDLGACKTCHLANTYDIPLAQGVLPSTTRVFTCTEPRAADANDYCDAPNWALSGAPTVTPPITAVCTSCHDTAHAAAHAITMTTAAGAESCATCHRVGAANGIDVYHRLAP